MWRSLPPRWAGLLDQGLFSAFTFLQIAVYARVLLVDEFGHFAVAMSGCMIMQSLQRAVVGNGMIADIASGGVLRAGAWWRWNWVVTGLASAGAAASALCLLMVANRGWGFSLAAAAAMIVPFSVYEFVRRALLISEHYNRAVICSTVFFCVQAIGLGIVTFKPSLSAAFSAFFLACSLAALASFLISRKLLKLAEAAETQLIRRHARQLLWNAAALIPYVGFNSAMPLLVASKGGAAVAAAFVATRIFLAPISILIAAIDSVDKPRATRALLADGEAGLVKSLSRTSATLLASSAPYMIAALVFAPDILRLVVGPAYASQELAARLWLCVGLLMMIGQPLETGLLILRRSHLFFWSRLAGCLTAIALMLIVLDASSVDAGVKAAAAAWFVSCAAAALFLITFLLRRIQKPGDATR